MDNPVFVLAVAVVLDWILGDPGYLWHPVMGIGNLIKMLESMLYRPEDSEKRKKAKGGALLLWTVFVTAGLVILLIAVAGEISKTLQTVLSVYFLWTGLAGRTLKMEGRGIGLALRNGNLELARCKLSFLVTRDTSTFQQEDVIKAAIETVSENTSDGVIAPLLYGALLGPAGMWMYKAVNTLDSMVGYKNERYQAFGFYSAKMDDVLNYIPARVTAWLLIISSSMKPKRIKKTAAVYNRFKRCHESPNAGYPEAAVAGALSIALGGDAVYFGEVIHKQEIGIPEKKPETEDIFCCIKIMERTYIIGSILILSIMLAFRR